MMEASPPTEVEIKEEDPECSYSGLEFTEEDVEPFAIGPEDPPIPSTPCLFCFNAEATPWPLGRKGDVPVFLASLARLLSLREEKRALIHEAGYCKECQDGIEFASQLLQELDCLQQKISEMKDKFRERLETGQLECGPGRISDLRVKVLEGMGGILNTKVGNPPLRNKGNVKKKRQSTATRAAMRRKARRHPSTRISTVEIDERTIKAELEEEESVRSPEEIEEPCDEMICSDAEETITPDNDYQNQGNGSEQDVITTRQLRPRTNPRPSVQKVRKKVKKHPASVLSVEEKFTCNICGYKMKTEQRLQNHLAKWHEKNPRPFKCLEPNCGKSFKQARHVKSHSYTHTQNHPYNCSYCNRKFVFKSGLKHHILLSHPETVPPETLNKVQTCSYKCEYCGKVFSAKQTYQTHRYTHTKNYPFKCEICGRGCINKSYLDEHMVGNHGGGFKCTFEGCTTVSVSRRYLRLHVLTHSDNFSFFCEICGKGCITHGALKHHQEQHSNLTFQCDKCPKKFKYKSTLKAHQDVHEGKRKYKVCEKCGKAFKDQWKLTVHEKRVHTNRPFQCPKPKCGKCFYTEDFLNTHMEYHRIALEQGKTRISDAKIPRVHAAGTTGARSKAPKRPPANKKESSDPIAFNYTATPSAL